MVGVNTIGNYKTWNYACKYDQKLLKSSLLNTAGRQTSRKHGQASKQHKMEHET